MSAKKVTIDEVALNKYHLKLIAYCSGCSIVAGYVVGAVAISLSTMSKQMPMTATMSGLVGTGTLIGMIFGSMIGGYITDKIGRKKMYVLDFLFMAIVNILQFFVASPIQAFALRLLLGIGVGVTFTIAGPYLAELSPQKNRGVIVSALNVLWYVGYAISNVVCYLLLATGDNCWRWMLLSGAVPCILWLIGIRKMPESPRWLAGHGRGSEVDAVLKKIGPNVIMPLDEEQEQKQTSGFLEIFKNGNGKWIFFVAAFWSMQIISFFAVGTYLPTIIEQLGFGSGNKQYLGSAIINCLYLIGAIPIFAFMDRAGRRPTLIWSFVISTIPLFILAFTADKNLSFILILILFVTFGASNMAGAALDYVYPNELFPTQIRATAVGFITGLTRVISAISTFLTPVIIQSMGLKTALFICAVTSLAGFVLSVVMAPETKDMNLSEINSKDENNNHLRKERLVTNTVKDGI